MVNACRIRTQSHTLALQGFEMLLLKHLNAERKKEN
jgi:hypothetical protein